MGFHSRDRLVYVLGPPRLLEDARAIRERASLGWEETIKSQGRASEPAQAKRRSALEGLDEEQPAGKPWRRQIRQSGTP